MTTTQDPKKLWDESFAEQISRQAYNTAPVGDLVRNASYYLRARHAQKDFQNLHFLEMGCGAGPNLKWLAEKDIKVSGIDISPTALELCRKNLSKSGFGNRVGKLIEGSVTNVPFEDASFDGILESCVFQHLNKKDRDMAFSEVRRLLKPGGCFLGHMLEVGHTIFQKKKSEQLSDDPGSLLLQDGKSKYYLSNIGISHFFSKEELQGYLSGFSIIDPCLTTYYYPQEEAKKRGYSEYLQSMFAVYAVK